MSKVTAAGWLVVLILATGLVGVGAAEAIKAWNIRSIVDIENVPNVNYSSSLFVSSSDQLDTPLTQILWGTIQNGTSKSVVIYVKNVGDAPTVISVYNGNYSVSDPSIYLSASAIILDPSLDPQEYTTVTLTLTAIASAPTIASFEFDTAIIAE